jgi:Type VI secretion system/phage-baseplate injector OB domain
VVYHRANGDEPGAVAMKRKLFGKYRGRVEDNADPQGLGRVEVSSPAALGAGARAWALPCVPYALPGVGLAMLPPVGADVWVEFEGGDPRHPIWTGFLWDSPPTPPPTGDDVIVTTRGGHRLVLSDSGNEVTLSHSGGSTVKLDAAGRVEVSASSDIRMTAAKVAVEAGMVEASGVVKCETLVANSVVASSYTPGAGNIW